MAKKTAAPKPAAPKKEVVATGPQKSSPPPLPTGKRVPPSPHAGPPLDTLTIGPYAAAPSMPAFLQTIPPLPPGHTRALLYNVNGFRASFGDEGRKADMLAWFAQERADVVSLQEIKIDAGKAAALPPLPGWEARFHCADKPGYAGTAFLVRAGSPAAAAPFTVGMPGFADDEGRVCTLELPGVWVVNAYVPNSGAGLERLNWRTKTWDPAFRAYLVGLAATKPVIVLGDLNVAFHDCDVGNPVTYRNKIAGFTDPERDGFAELLSAGLHNVWREKHPDVRAYT